MSNNLREKFKIETLVSKSETGLAGTKFRPNLKREISPSVKGTEDKLKTLTFIVEYLGSDFSSGLVFPNEKKNSLEVSPLMAFDYFQFHTVEDALVAS